MLEQVLNREFILNRLREVRRYLEMPNQELHPGRRDTAEPEPLNTRERDLLLEDVRKGEVEEDAQSTGQEGYDLPSGRRGGAQALPLSHASFFSRSPVISNFQSAIEQYYEEQKPQQIETISVGGRRRGQQAVVATTDRRISGLPPEITPSGQRRFLGAFEQTDVRWISALAGEGLRLLKGKHRFNTNPATAAPRPISNKARLIVIGDWGTGLPRARTVANEMARCIREGKDKNLEQHVIHLGDVYYSGWKREYRDRFLKYWPVTSGDKDKISSWTLNGNHDMFAGGFGYYDVALQEERFKDWHKGSSFFSLANDEWVIFGLDTAYDDFDLRPPQADWVYSQINAPALSSKKVMLLSHHQLFSAYEHGGPKLASKLDRVLATGRVRSWFWGHEHRCVLYHDFDKVTYGRCLGNGGVPVYMNHIEGEGYKEPAVYEYRKYIDAGLELWALFGFAVLDFDGKNINVRYIDEFGNNFKSEMIA